MNTNYREEFEELTNKFALLTESCHRQEQNLTEFYKFYAEHEDFLLKSLTTSLEKAIQTSLDAALERHYRGLSLDNGMPSGQLGDDQLAGYFSWRENSGPMINHSDHVSSPHRTCEEGLSGGSIGNTGDSVTVLQLEQQAGCHSDLLGCSVSADSASGPEIGQTEAGLSTAPPDALVDAEQETESRITLAQDEPKSDGRNVADVGDETMMVVDGAPHSILGSEVDGILKQDCSSRVKCVRFDDEHLCEDPMSPLSDIPEEPNEDDPPGCPPSRSTRSSSKRKEGFDIVPCLPPPKKSKGVSHAATRGRPPKKNI